MRVKPRRSPSNTPSSRTTSTSMPVSSFTSFTATSLGE